LKPYIEVELNWLVEKEFIEKRKDKYITMFYIEDSESITKIANVFFQNKAKFTDKLIERLAVKYEKIKQIGFYGSDKPIDKMLWFLIYTFIDYARYHYCSEVHNINIEWPIRRDGGNYHILGRVLADKSIPMHISEKNYANFSENTYSWNLTWEESSNRINALGINILPDDNLLKFGINSSKSNIKDLRNMLLNSLREDFDIEKLSLEDKAILSKLVSQGCISVSEADDRGIRKIIPHFVVFTPTQWTDLIQIYKEVYKEMSTEYECLAGDLRNAVNEILPPQLDSFKDHALYIFLKLGGLYQTLFAYLDKKLYIPKDDKENILLTMNVTVE
jgi:hypothetical protein